MRMIAAWSMLFLSTPSARRATQAVLRRMRLPDISIHALREEGDLGFGTERLLRLKISIHALREEGDHARGAQGQASEISIHALREEGDRGHESSLQGLPISIHALREEGDAQRGWSRATPRYFYPRPPRGGRPSPPCWTTTP